MITKRIALYFIIFAVSVSCVFAANDATMFRYDPAQTGYTPDKVSFPLSLSWEYIGARMAQNLMTPAIQGNIIVFASDNRIFGLDRESGAEIWKYPSDNGLNGKIRRTPAIYDGKVYFGCGDSNVYCLNVATGELVWIFGTKGAVKGAPIVTDGVVYIGSDDDSVYALDALTGDAIWPKPFTARDDMSYGLAVGSGVIVGVCGNGNIYGINQNSGKPKWVYKMPSSNLESTPTIIDNVVVIAVSNVVYGINIRSGQQRWSVQLSEDVVGSPVFKDADMYVPCKDGNIYAYTITSRDARKKWKDPIKIDQAPAGPGVIAGDTLIQPGRLGLIIALDTETGKTKWKYMVARTIRQSEQNLINANKINNPAGGGAIDPGMIDAIPVMGPQANMPVGVPGMEDVPGVGNGGGGGGYVPTLPGVSTDLGPITSISQINDYASPVVANGNLYLVSEDGVLRSFASDAPDQEAPIILDMQPKNGLRVSATPPLTIAAVLYDQGSGIDYSTVTLTHFEPGNTVGEKLNVEVDDLKSRIKYEFMAGSSTQAVKLLANGTHTLSLTVADYSGNTATKEWSFIADSSITPPKVIRADDKPAPAGRQGRGQNQGQQNNRNNRNNNNSNTPPPPPMMNAPSNPGR